MFICKSCGIHFDAPSSRKRDQNRIYCTSSCYRNHMRKNGRPEISKQASKKCGHCQNLFTDKPSKIQNRIFCSSKCRAKWQSSLPYDQWRNKISEGNKGKCVGNKNGMYGVSPKHPGKIKPFVDRLGRITVFRSSWEVVVAKYLDGLSINWLYEHKRFRFPTGTYVPDFYLPDLDCYWEVKGWFNEKSQEKVSQFRRLYPELNLVVLTKPAYDQIVKLNKSLIREDAE